MKKEISTPAAIVCFIVLSIITGFSQYKLKKDLAKIGNDAKKHLDNCKAESDRIMKNLTK